MGCEHVEYREFSKQIHTKAVDLLIGGGIDITSRCNLRCVHCYIEGALPGRELSYAEICHLFDQIADEGCLWLLITGGEPLARPDFLDIYSYAKRKGFIISLFTNATLLTPSIAGFLAEEPPFVIEVSLYGMTADTYERVTGVPGSFERCRRGIELVRARDLPLRLKTMVLTLNQHELQDMKRYAKTLGVSFKSDAMINGRLDGSAAPAEFRLSPEDIVTSELADEAVASEWRQFCDKFWGPSGSDYLYTCGAGKNSFHISSTGELTACVMARQPAYNLRQGNFHEAFYSFLPEVRAQKRRRHSECQWCPMIYLCGQCPGWALLESGDPETKVNFLCRVAHLRAAAFKAGWQEQAADRSNQR